MLLLFWRLLPWSSLVLLDTLKLPKVCALSKLFGQSILAKNVGVAFTKIGKNSALYVASSFLTLLYLATEGSSREIPHDELKTSVALWLSSLTRSMLMV